METTEIINLIPGDHFKFSNEEGAKVWRFREHTKSVRWKFSPVDNDKEVRTSVRTTAVFTEQ